MKSKRHRVPYAVRVLLTIVFLYIAHLQGLSLLYLPLAMYLAVSIAWIILVEFFYEQVRKRPWNKIIRDIFDLVFFTLIVYMTGGAGSFLILLYLGWTVGSSMQDKRVYGLVASLGSCVLFGILMLMLGFNILPMYDCFADSPVPFSAGRGAAAWFALLISTITIHDFIFKLYSTLLRDKIQLQLEMKERALSVEALHESEEKYRIIVDNIKESYYELDRAGNFTFVNQSMCRILGRTLDELIGLNFRDYLPEEAADTAFVVFNRVFELGVRAELVEIPVYQKDGTLRFIEVSIDLRTDSNGAGIGFRGMVRDTTARKEIEDSLRRSEEKYRTLLQTNNVGYIEMDLKGNITYCNDITESFTGYTRGELIGSNYTKLMSAEMAGEVFKTYHSVFRKEIAFGSADNEIIRKDGAAGYFETTISLVTDRAGNPKGFRVIGIDITNRKQIEEALRESEERYRLVMENINDAVFICRLDGHLKYMSPSMARLSGYSADEMFNEHYLHYIRPDYRKRELDLYMKQVQEGIEVTVHEYPFMAKGDRTIWVGQTVRMVKNNEGEIEFFGVIRDISERKAAEEERHDLEEAKTRFFSNISHEIRTPLTLMLGPIESVLQGNYDGEVGGEFFENLHRNTLSLLKLVNNLLDFSKIEAGRMTMRVLEGDIVSFARGYLTSMETVGKTRKIEMRFNSSADSIMLYFDPERLDKVFMNLLSNAFKFTEAGDVITITVSEDDDNCRVKVADTGEGIPEKSLGAIFERFNQADTASTRRHQGTGIGLALAKELVEMHGGTITAESRYIAEFPDNHGSIFTIALPKGRTHFENRTQVEIVENTGLDAFVKDYRVIGIREMAELKNDDTAPARSENIEHFPIRGDEKSILVVEDNADMRNFLKILLQKKYRVILAENGEEGILCARTHRPKLIITDVMMPVMSGFEMTAIIKNDEELKTTPVIMLTADTELVSKVAGLEFGADDYLHKPFNSIELMTRISSLLKNYEYQQIISSRNREIESELDVARMLQLRLLPASLPEIPGYNIHVLCISMDKVGGDFYDIERREDSVDIFIADVCGHGLPGAFLATVTKISFENITTRTTPANVMFLLNDVIRRYTVNSNFVTAFYAAIDITTRVIRYSCGGHVTPLLYRRKNDEFIELKAKGTLLGIFKNIKIEEKMIQLESGDRVFFYTDGITECTNPATVFFDEFRLRKSIKEHAGKTAEEFSHELMKELEAFKGEKTFDDDITMVVLDVL